MTKDGTTKIDTYNWGRMWSTEIQQVLSKACKTLDNFFLFSWIFFGNFIETEQGFAQFGLGPNNVKKLL